MHWSQFFVPGNPSVTEAGSTATGALHASASGTRKGWPRPASNRLWAARADSYDNALAETIDGLYKVELIHRRGPWKTKEAVELATLEWVSLVQPPPSA
jgi:hypothetical protein